MGIVTAVAATKPAGGGATADGSTRVVSTAGTGGTGISGGTKILPPPMILVSILSRLAMMEDSILVRSSSVATGEDFATSFPVAAVLSRAAAAASKVDNPS